MPVKQLASFVCSRSPGSRSRHVTPEPSPAATRDRVPVMERLEQRSMMTVVLPGGVAILPGTTAAAQPALAGVVVRDVMIPFSVHDAGGNEIFRGTLQDSVTRENGTGR